MNEESVDAGPSHAVKVGQRPVKSCSFCHRRKIRCDQQIPCSRCVARGIGDLCKPEIRIVKGRLVGEPHSPASSVKGRDRGHEPTYQELVKENKALHRRIAAQQAMLEGQRAIPQYLGNIGTPSSVTPGPEFEKRDLPLAKSQRSEIDLANEQPVWALNVHHSRSLSEDRGDGVLGVSRLEILSSLYHLRGIMDWESASEMLTPKDDHVLKQTIALIEPHVSSHLVQFHNAALLWLHCVYHGPTFLEEHDAWMLEKQMGVAAEKSYEYLSVYFAIISSSLYFMDEEEAAQIGILPNVIPVLCKLWLGAAFHCLKNSGFMVVPSMQSLQAVCILSLIGHHYGHTPYIASIFTCAIDQAARMGLHHLRGGAGTGDHLRDELGRRIWACLSIWEALDLSRVASGLLYPPADTLPPSNVDDVELRPDRQHLGHPPSRTTQASHLLAMTRLADASRDLFFALRNKTSMRARYQYVHHFATQLAEHHLDDFPDLRPLPPGHEATGGMSDQQHRALLPDYRPWSRFNWSLAMGSLRLSMYKPFLNLAYTKGGEWTEVREICLSLAQGTLANRRKPGPTPAMWQKQWHVTSDTVLAGAVVASELVYGGHHDPVIRQELRAQVEDCIDMLETLGPVTRISERGVRLLSSMLRRDAQIQATKATGGPTSQQPQPTAQPSSHQIHAQYGPSYSENAVASEVPQQPTHDSTASLPVSIGNEEALDFGWSQSSGPSAAAGTQYAAVPSTDAEGFPSGVSVDDFAAVGEWLDEILGNSGFDHFLS